MAPTAAPPVAGGLPALPLPGENGAPVVEGAAEPEGEARELTLQLGEEGELTIVEDSAEVEQPDGEPEPEAEPEPESEPEPPAEPEEEA